MGRFIPHGNAVDLAVGIVIGAAFTAVVNGFVRAFPTPLVGLASGITGVLGRKTFTAGRTEFPYGAFVNATISFVLVAAALYFLVLLPVNKLHERCAPPVPTQARRCAACTSPLPTLPAQEAATRAGE
ncbi:MscL family protein [Streptomyces sp. NPDC093595]|uniref:MscL family protein n=1 Tax=Streptomyces sp. NPDC093595 TaxID=3366045 RepID=UPI003820B0CC